VHGLLASSTRQGPLGEVVLEVALKRAGSGVTAADTYRRVGPIERIKDHLEALECYACSLDRDDEHAYPWSRCSTGRTARWYADRGECDRAAAADAGSPGGHPFPSGVACELDAEGERTADAEDAKDYGPANQKLEAALGAARKRVRSFQSALSRTRHVFVRENSACRSWDLRQDRDSASGWISREDALTSGGRQLSEFRFAASAEAVRLTGWITTPLLSSQPPSEEVRYGPMCEAWTTLIDASDSAAKFTDQVWFFSRAACERGAADVSPDAGGFGPACERKGR
jgi:hypothetical protein